jgi:branched-chain amino acid transport system substrate-binding protein
MTKAARGDNAATLYGVLSQNALAMAPIAQREKMPLVISFSSVDEITKPGDYIYRTSTSEGHYYDGMVKYFVEQQKMKSMAVWFASDNATAVGNAEKTMPALAKKYNVKITGTVSVKSTDTDFSSSAAKIAGQKPDAVAVLILGAGVNTAITSLRRAGYKGALFGSTALGAGALKASGANSKDTYYPAAILASPDVPWASGKKFLEGYKAASGTDATAFTAAGNDQVQFLADAIKTIDGEVTTESVHEALKTTAKAGFSGATGDPVKFDENRNAVTPGLMIRWDGTKETFADNQASPLLEEYGGQ